jgi:hypothetical protein
LEAKREGAEGLRAEACAAAVDGGAAALLLASRVHTRFCGSDAD